MSTPKNLEDLLEEAKSRRRYELDIVHDAGIRAQVWDEVATLVSLTMHAMAEAGKGS